MLLFVSQVVYLAREFYPIMASQLIVSVPLLNSVIQINATVHLTPEMLVAQYVKCRHRAYVMWNLTGSSQVLQTANRSLPTCLLYKTKRSHTVNLK